MASLKQLTVAIPGAGRRTLLAALKEDYVLPDDFRLCVLDAERLTDSRQLALLDELAADPDLRILFALNKADRVIGKRTLVTRTLALLRDRGFVRPELFPICARAARLFRLPPEKIAGSELMSELGDFYFRFGPGEQCLSAFSVTRDSAICLGSREVSPERLRLALENTGVPTLEGRLAARAKKQTAAKPRPAEKAPVEAAAERPDEAAGSREQGTGNAVGAVIDRPPELTDSVPDAENKVPDAPVEATGNREQATGEGETDPSTPLRSAQDDAAEGGAPAEATGNGQEATGEEGTDPSTPLRSAQDDAAGGGALDAPPATADNAPAEATGEEETDPSDGGTDPSTPLRSAQDDAAGGGALDAPPETTGDALDTPPETADDVPDTSDARPEDADEAEAVDGTDSAMKALMARAAQADCAELLELAKAVAADPAADEYRNEALDALHEAYKEHELEELEALTLDADTLGPEGLRELIDRINSGAYTVQTRTPYLEALNLRLDELQAEALEALCAEVPEADDHTLAQIRAELEEINCAEHLKTEHFRAIEARQTQLDLEALERVTAGAEQMSEKELRAVAVTLEAGNWNPKFVNAYRHKVELCREAAILRELNDELAELDDMERRELLALRESILNRELPLRFTAAPLTRIDEKIYRLDMLRLLALCNDFDSLDYDGLDALRAQVGRGDWCERARNEYLSRLLEREEALVIENTDARAQLVRQLIGQHKLRMTDFDIASASPAYEERLAAFWGGSGMEQPRDIPVFILDNASDFALTGSRFYYKTGRDLAFLPLDNIERFQAMKQRMGLILQVVGKDSSYRLTGARLGRSGSERVLAFLNECVQRWNEPGVQGAPSASPIRTRRFEPADYTAPVEELLPDERMALEIFRGRCQRDKLREGNLIREGEDGWEQRTRRLLLNFELPETTQLIWYCSSTLLGTVREGVALGPKAIYQKESRQPTQIIPLQEIMSMTRSGKQVTVSTVRGQSFRIDLPLAMLSPVQDYVKAIQLGAYLRDR